ncbi:MAG: hypothetical protein ACR2KE_04275 [Candidatus Nanopelagicales bacterium]
MTTTRPAPKPKRSRAGERMLAVGLASTACIGLVGVIGVRSALSQEPDNATATDPVTSNGYTQADLDAYAAQLASQAQQLDAYKRQLKDAAQQLNDQITAYNQALSTGQPVYVQDQGTAIPNGNSGSGSVNAGGGNSGSQWVPAPQPQSHTKSS